RSENVCPRTSASPFRGTSPSSRRRNVRRTVPTAPSAALIPAGRPGRREARKDPPPAPDGGDMREARMKRRVADESRHLPHAGTAGGGPFTGCGLHRLGRGGLRQNAGSGGAV